ncbi:TraX family protein [Streptococcus ovis]|uniref:TraX family protein n=1 Tax=Streptococcus ovis TaxID=82806 RepID=UPI000362440D|nr:TraX family protein [Streptococcus ovis]
MMKKLAAFHLKGIAIVAMFINHVGHAFELEWNPPLWQFLYLAIGLITFPVMAYLLVEGFFYTRNRMKYIGRMAIFWLISILPFHVIFDVGASFINPVNNIFFTLMMGLVLLQLCEQFSDDWVQFLLACLFILLTIQSDWNVFGIPIIFSYYKMRGQSDVPRTILVRMTLVMLLLTFPGKLIPWSPSFINWLSSFGLLLVVPILQSYNGERGYSPTWVKWGFYLFYPVHLTALFLIRYLIFGY